MVLKHNKKLTVVLGVGVVCIWGMIIFKITETFFSRSDNKPSVALTNLSNEEKNILQDTFKLLMNYNDPFLTDKSFNKLPVINVTSAVKNHTKKLPLLADTAIHYFGSISTKRKLTMLLKVSGIYYQATEGQTVGALVVVKGNTDSVRLKSKGRLFWIRRHKVQ